METLTFTARRSDTGWALECDALPTVRISSPRLTDAHARVRAAVAASTGARLEDVDVVIAPVLPDPAASHLGTARDLQDQIRDLADRLTRELATGVQLLQADGLTQREIALALGVSVSRVQQLAAQSVDEPTSLTWRHMTSLYDSGALRPE